jgi:hypothetical protein
LPPFSTVGLAEFDGKATFAVVIPSAEHGSNLAFVGAFIICIGYVADAPLGGKRVLRAKLKSNG